MPVRETYHSENSTLEFLLGDMEYFDSMEGRDLADARECPIQRLLLQLFPHQIEMRCRREYGNIPALPSECQCHIIEQIGGGDSVRRENKCMNQYLLRHQSNFYNTLPLKLHLNNGLQVARLFTLFLHALPQIPDRSDHQFRTTSVHPISEHSSE